MSVTFSFLVLVPLLRPLPFGGGAELLAGCGMLLAPVLNPIRKSRFRRCFGRLLRDRRA